MEELWLGTYRIELPEKKMTQTLQINNLAELENRQLNFTNKFVAPITPNNVKAMNYLGIAGSTSRVPYQKIDAKYVLDGIELVKNGRALVSKSSDSGYEITIYSGNVSLYEALTGFRMNDLNFDDVNHFLNLTTYENSLTNTEGYIYAIGDYGHDSPSAIINVQYQSPALYLHSLIKKIITQAGFTYSGAIFSDVNFLNEVVTGVYGYDASGEETTETDLGDVTTDTIYEVEANARDPLTFEEQFTLSTTGLTQSQIVNNAIQVDYDGVLNLSLDITSTKDGGFGWYKIIKNGTVIKSITIPEGSSVTTLQDLAVNVDNGDLITFWLHSATDDGELEISVSTDINLSESAGGLHIDFAVMMPDKSQIDFIKDWMQDYGLIFQSNGVNLDFITMEELYNDRARANDWSDKLTYKGSDSYSIGSYSQNNYMKYNYSDDEQTDITSHDGNLQVNNYNLTDEKTLFTSIYNISDKSFTRFGESIYSIPIWEYNDSDALVENQETAFRKFSIKRVSGTITIKIGDVAGTVSITDNIPVLSLDNISYDFYIANYYSAFKRMLDNQVKKTVKFYLSLIDIYNIDFFKLIYLKQFGQYYYLNKVSNFIDGVQTVCELIQVNELTTNKAPSQLGTKSISISNGSYRVLKLSDFTETIPVYADPEFDQPQTIKITSFGSTDVDIKNNGVTITSDTIVDANDLKLQIEDSGNTATAHTATFTFTIQSYNNPDFSTEIGTIDVSISAQVNEAPTADAGANRTLDYNSETTGAGSIVLDGCNSYDPNDDTLTYLWTLENNTFGLTITDDDTCEPTVDGVDLEDFMSGRNITARLRVTDTEGLYDEDTITITLNDTKDNPI